MTNIIDYWIQNLLHKQKAESKYELIYKEALKENKNIIITGYKHNPSYSELKEISIDNGNLNNFTSKLNNKSVVCLVAGCRGSGKTALSFRLLENIKSQTNRSMFAVGFPNQNLPNWINHAETIDEIPNGSVVLWDEAGITLNQTSTFNTVTRDVSNLLKIARHKDLSLIFISQNVGNLNLNVVRMIDIAFLLKDSLWQQFTDRGFIRKLYENIKISEHPFDYSTNGQVYIIDSEFTGMMNFKLPSFWTSEISKSFANSK